MSLIVWGSALSSFCKNCARVARRWYDPWQALEETLKARILLRLERAGRLAKDTLHEIFAARRRSHPARELILQARSNHSKAAQTAMILVLATDCVRPSSLSAEQLQDFAALERQAVELCAFLVQSLRMGVGG